MKCTTYEALQSIGIIRIMPRPLRHYVIPRKRAAQPLQLSGTTGGPLRRHPPASSYGCSCEKFHVVLSPVKVEALNACRDNYNRASPQLTLTDSLAHDAIR
jgi:hypothetical protein